MQEKKLLIIANPCSGKAKIKNDLLKIVQIFSNADYEVTVYPTKSRGDATVKAESLKQDEFDRIVVCGGDGTLNEVITGIMHSGIKCTLGYIPLGTLNEWSSGLKISRNAIKAAEDVVIGAETDLDIGKFDDKYFSYTASFGAFTDASYSAPQEIKNVLGQAAYFFQGIKSLSNIKPIHLKFICDDREIEGDFLFGAVSNSMSVGGIVKFSDSVVKLNDGKFEVLLIKNPTSILQFQSIVDGILRKDLERDGIEFFHAHEVTVTGGADVAWTLDGEYAEGKDAVTLTNMPSAIHLIVPQNTELK
ncbi:MAG: diacylglycerol kinase family protein [Acutalibacteraceae bacterium]|nr:diacylglycerol kinase family protein [Acutalibacteraceae bacterium]